MQTQLPLHSIGPVIHGYHENPFEVLGPHEIEQNGRRALAVRAYLPEAQRAWVVDPAHGVTSTKLSSKKTSPSPPNAPPQF